MATSPNHNMTYAQALTDAKSLIVQQSARIKADAQKIKAQADEIAQWRKMSDEMGAEIERASAEIERLRRRVGELEPKLADAQSALEHAESTIGRQQMEIEALDGTSRELQKILGDQAARINDLTAELEQTRDALPTHEDEAALEAMSSLLSAARKQKKGADHAPAVQIVQDASSHDRRMERMVIPADPTPFCEVAARKAA
jgi:predicted RNase H-like nuclease (RuvC/YqgF family)